MLDETALVIEDGDTETLTASTWPSGGTVTWSSSNEAVATVDDGVVTAVDPGACVITATTTYLGYTYTADCAVTVVSEA